MIHIFHIALNVMIKANKIIHDTIDHLYKIHILIAFMEMELISLAGRSW